MKQMMNTKRAEANGARRSRGVRKRYTLQEKLQIIEQTRRPGASVLRVARERGINANLVFTWRRQHARGELIAGSVPALLPIRVAPKHAQAPEAMPMGSDKPEGGFIELDLPGACVRIHGCVARETLAHVIELLRRR